MNEINEFNASAVEIVYPPKKTPLASYEFAILAQYGF